MKDKYTAQAPTTEEAIDKGLKALGIKRDNADITISQESKKGFLGIGQKDAVVVVKRKNAKNPVEDLVSKEILLGEKEPSTIEPEIKEAAEPDDKHMPDFSFDLISFDRISKFFPYGKSDTKMRLVFFV